jgi:hypothetical protein
MMVTEETAEMKRCCGPEGCGTSSTPGGERFCIASQCMAWRWGGQGSNGPTGYCGLAGAPPE